MQPVRHLGKLKRAAVRRAAYLRMLIDNYRVPIASEQDRTVAFVALEALNLWASFSRTFYLSCIFNAKTEAGTRVTIATAGINSLATAIGYSVQTVKPLVWARNPTGPWTRRDEPTWHETATILRLFTVMGASNLAQVQAALSLQTDVFLQLPPMRNFFAHRNHDTRLKTANVARAIGVSGRQKPCDVLCSIAPSRPQSILADWLDDLASIMDLMCQ